MSTGTLVFLFKSVQVDNTLYSQVIIPQRSISQTVTCLKFNTNMAAAGRICSPRKSSSSRRDPSRSISPKKLSRRERSRSPVSSRRKVRSRSPPCRSIELGYLSYEFESANEKKTKKRLVTIEGTRPKLLYVVVGCPGRLSLSLH
jgi:hypothetical protein